MLLRLIVLVVLVASPASGSGLVAVTIGFGVGQGEEDRTSPNGSAVVGVEFGLCSIATEVGVAERAYGQPHALGKILVASPNNPDCLVRFDELRAGDYRAFAKSAAGVLGTSDLVVAARAEERVVITRPATTVQGRVFLDGRVWPMAKLTFVLPDGDIAVRVSADEQGQYVALLGDPGSYLVQVLAPANPIVSWTTTVNVLRGVQLHDLLVGGGRLEVMVRGGDASGYLNLALTSGPTTLRQRAAVLPSGTATAVFFLPFGRYQIGAFQERRASRNVAVDLDSTSPQASVDLYLIENPSLFIVRDESGAILGKARATGGGQVLSKERDGAFSLSGIPLGSPVTVGAPGFVPTCRRSEQVGVLQIVLERGAPADFSFPADTGPTPVGDISGLPNASCAVSLREFGYVRLPPEPKHPNMFRILRLPARGRLTWTLGDREMPIVLPATAPIVVSRDGDGRW